MRISNIAAKQIESFILEENPGFLCQAVKGRRTNQLSHQFCSEWNRRRSISFSDRANKVEAADTSANGCMQAGLLPIAKMAAQRSIGSPAKIFSPPAKRVEERTRRTVQRWKLPLRHAVFLHEM